MEEVKIAYCKVDTDRAAKSGKAHDCDNLDQVSVQLGASRHEQEQAAYRAQATAKSGTIVRDNWDQRGRYLSESWNIQPNESQIGGHEDRGHPKNRDCESCENEAH